ncbi:MAG: hypothetical protein LBG11_10010, partial [Bifidobacteriaceae bacterium]|nr:hypothetical protein [Bifidobacteriaceae bacterium]
MTANSAAPRVTTPGPPRLRLPARPFGLGTATPFPLSSLGNALPQARSSTSLVADAVVQPTPPAARPAPLGPGPVQVQPPPTYGQGPNHGPAYGYGSP